MSDTHTWNVNIESPTTGSAAFQETSAVVGETINAGFSWSNAKYHQLGECYAAMYIYNPNNVIVAAYDETTYNTGTKNLPYITDMAGTWTAEISVWDGINWLTFTDTIGVGGPNIKIEPSSEFFTGPFIEGTMQTVCNVHVKNHGAVEAPVTIELWEYPNSSQQNMLTSTLTIALAPGATFIVQLDTVMPDVMSWPLGVKVWGAGEPEPGW